MEAKANYVIIANLRKNEASITSQILALRNYNQIFAVSNCKDSDAEKIAEALRKHEGPVVVFFSLQDENEVAMLASLASYKFTKTELQRLSVYFMGKKQRTVTEDKVRKVLPYAMKVQMGTQESDIEGILGSKVAKQ